MPSADPVSSLPRYQTAIVAQGPGRLAIQHDAPVPSLALDMAMVKTEAVAINPVDAKMLDYSAAAGAIHGYDFAGTVVALGADVLASGRLAVGDRVAGMVHGMNKLQPDVGAFAEYVGACADLLVKLPDNMSFEEGASFGVGVATSIVGIFGELRVPVTLDQLRAVEKVPVSAADGKNGDFVLVAGGSTASGTRAIQLLRLAGLRPLATCSPENSDLALRFGAEKVFDYHSPSCAAEIRAYTGNQLRYALDCVSQAETTQMCYAAIGRAGGRYVSLEPFSEGVTKTRPSTIEPSWVMVLTIFGRKVALDGEYGREARPEDRRLGAQGFSAIQELVDRGLIDTHPVKALPGGWEGVMRGVDMIRHQPPSGHKLVCRVK